MEQAATNSYIDQHDQKVVLTIKYKIYIVVLVVITVICRGYMNESVARYTATKTNIDNLNQQKMMKDAEYNQVVKDLLTIRDVNSQKSALLTCFSTRGCTTIPESLSGNSAQIKAFLQLQKNEGSKMEFDQKKVLANINEYLLKGPNASFNGNITSIIFGNLSPVEGITNLVQLPITLTVDFADKNGLLSFVYNVENIISAQFPMLYKLRSVNYDIVKYQENQTVTIELVGYMIK